MSTLNISDIANVVSKLPANVSVLLRGDHGIGKSALARQIAAEVAKAEGLADFPVIDRRLSQMSQGDLIGLPKLEDGSTRFYPADWYMMACRQPCLLLLDELNRAIIEVMQSAMQIVLDRELDGHRLHPQTRIIAAVNTNSVYNVNPIDPALLDRFFVIDVRTTADAWCNYAKEVGLHPSLIEFIKQNGEKWLFADSTIDQSSKQQSPRSVERFALAAKPYFDAADATGKWDLEMVRKIASGFCGSDWAMMFNGHLNQPFVVSGEDLANKFWCTNVTKTVTDEIDPETNEPKVITELDHTGNIFASVNTERVDIMMVATDRLCDYLDTLETVNDVQGENLRKFMWSQPNKDQRVKIWQRLARQGLPRIEFIKSIHEYVVDAILDVFGVPRGPAGVGVLPNVHGAVQYADEEEKKE